MVKMKTTYLGAMKTECIHESGTAIQTDPPKDVGGEGRVFSPTDLFAASLGTCMLTVMGIVAKTVGFDLKGTTAEIEKEMSATPLRRVARIVVRIRCPHTPKDHIREKLETAALQCPISLSLHPEIKKEVDFIWGL